MNLAIVRSMPDYVKENQRKRFLDDRIVDSILELDNAKLKELYQLEQLRKLKKTLSKSIGHLKKNANNNTEIVELDVDVLLTNEPNFNNYSVETLSNTSTKLTNMIKDLDTEIDNKQTKINSLIYSLGNILNADVHISPTEDDNKIIYQTNTNLDKKFDHIELGKKLGIIDTESGIKITGNRGYFLTGKGVTLNMALIMYATNFLEQKGYTMMQTPHTVSEELMSKITQLSEYTETLYKLDQTDKYLIATSEQPLTAYFNKKQVAKSELPIRFGGISECYRKETGAHGKQTRGIFRVHQFQKVEQFCVTQASESTKEFNNLVDIIKEFYTSLGINYRLVSIVSSALNNAASIKYDLEAWFPGSKFFGELVSCTNCLDYFSQRLGTKIAGTNEYVHMLNCTLMANTRVMCCLMETFQDDNGIVIPQVLTKYTNFDRIDFVN